jgi:hypothetical protein
MVDKITQYIQFFTFVKNSKYIIQNIILNYVTTLIIFLIQKGNIVQIRSSTPN